MFFRSFFFFFHSFSFPLNFVCDDDDNNDDDNENDQNKMNPLDGWMWKTKTKKNFDTATIYVWNVFQPLHLVSERKRKKKATNKISFWIQIHLDMAIFVIIPE